MPQFAGSAVEEVASLRAPEQPDEADLVRRAQLGSGAAFDRLVVSRGPDVYRYLLVRLRNESDARDALQETMTAAWQGLAGLRQPDRFWPWLVAIAARKAAAISRARPPEADYDFDLVPHDDESVLELRDAIARLPDHLRDVLVLRFRLQLTEKEVAELLGVRVGTVKSRSARARRALEELLR